MPATMESGHGVTFREDREPPGALRTTQSDNVLSRGVGMHPPPPPFRRAPNAGLYKTLPRRLNGVKAQSSGGNFFVDMYGGSDEYTYASGVSVSGGGGGGMGVGGGDDFGINYRRKGRQNLAFGQVAPAALSATAPGRAGRGGGVGTSADWGSTGSLPQMSSLSSSAKRIPPPLDLNSSQRRNRLEQQSSMRSSGRGLHSSTSQLNLSPF